MVPRQSIDTIQRHIHRQSSRAKQRTDCNLFVYLRRKGRVAMVRLRPSFTFTGAFLSSRLSYRIKWRGFTQDGGIVRISVNISFPGDLSLYISSHYIRVCRYHQVLTVTRKLQVHACPFSALNIICWYFLPARLTGIPHN